MQERKPKFLFAAGGTGGHLFPALAIADEVRRRFPDAVILFVGTAGKIEERIVPNRGYQLRTLWLSGFHRRLTLENLLFPLKVVVSLVQSFFLMRKFAPDVVMATGGYVSGPVGFVASVLGIPVIVHESNSYPGVTTRMLAPRARAVLVAFDEARKWLPSAHRVEVVGTPVRATLGTVSREDGARFFNLDPSKPTLLVFGGSLGAASINDAVLRMIRNEGMDELQLIWQTGRNDFERVKGMLEARAGVWLGPFIDRMEMAYAAADLVVCRAGATTIAELVAVQKPAILVPYPAAAADHQTHNAMALVKAGAAVLLPDARVREELAATVRSLLESPHRLDAMQRASATLRRADTLDRIIAITLDEMGRRKNGTGK